MLKLDSQFMTDLRGRQLAYCAAIEDVQVDEGAFDHVFWDPPYDKRTQDNTRRGKETKHGISAPMPLGFDPATTEKRLRWAAWAARACRRWALVFSDHESSMDWATALEAAGMVYVRSMIWVKTGDAELTHERPRQSATPQMTGDRPSSGHEVIVVAHHRGRRMRWNGGGKHGVYTAGVVRGEHRVHEAQKPLELIKEITRDFMTPGETVVDAFCGSGTLLAAAKHLRMGAVGLDLAKKWADYAQRRVDAAQATNQ
jgi:site-specific DNA-methyltransferase (adenine-specific)